MEVKTSFPSCKYRLLCNPEGTDIVYIVNIKDALVELVSDYTEYDYTGYKSGYRDTVTFKNGTRIHIEGNGCDAIRIIKDIDIDNITQEEINKILEG